MSWVQEAEQRLRVLLCCAAVISVDCCRWALYAGREAVDVKELWTSTHGLLRQSFEPQYLPDVETQLAFDPAKNLVRNHEVNQDGWGVGWYSHYNPLSHGASAGKPHELHRRRSGSGATEAGRSGSGGGSAHNPRPDDALAQLLASGVAKSKVMFAHIRAATDARSPRSENAHPFAFNRLLWMHNGSVRRKSALQDEVIASLARNAGCPAAGSPGSTSTVTGKGGDATVTAGAAATTKLVHGTTDSEYAGALFASFLNPSEGTVCERERFDLVELETAMRRTVQRIQQDDQCVDNDGDGAPDGSSLNFALSDGRYVIAVRYRTCRHEEPPSLYYAHDEAARKLWCASEPLDKTEANKAGRRWMLMAKDQMISYDTMTGVFKAQCLSEACEAELLHRSTRRAELR